MKKCSVMILAAIGLLLFTMIAGHAHAAEDTPNMPPFQNQSEPSGLSTYAIGKGDVLELSVWREPMLSGEMIVRNDGKVSVTLIGDMQAAGRTTEELKDEIQAKLKEYVSDPSVTVIVKQSGSQKFYVIGEVKSPGEYDLLKDLTIIQAISRAGGFTEWASKDEIILLRRENGAEKRIRVNYKDMVKGKNIDQNILLRANDTIVVP